MAARIPSRRRIHQGIASSCFAVLVAVASAPEASTPAASVTAAETAAATWEAGPPESSLQFEGAAQGEQFEGGFERFEVRIAFDPAAPEAATFDVRIEAGSVDSDNVERDEALRSPDFFDAGAHPLAHWRASGARSEGDGYVADGQLTLNGITQDVQLAFRWTADKGRALLEGEATLDRTAFEIGAGEWADADMIDHAVQVHTRLVLVPVSGTP